MDCLELGVSDRCTHQRYPVAVDELDEVFEQIVHEFRWRADMASFERAAEGAATDPVLPVAELPGNRVVVPHQRCVDLAQRIDGQVCARRCQLTRLLRCRNVAQCLHLGDGRLGAEEAELRFRPGNPTS